MKHRRLDRIFNPKTVAVIGASNKEGHIGSSLMDNLLGSGFDGVIYPINPKRESVHGVKCYPTISDAPDTVDLAVIATPAKTVPAIVEECGKAGVGGLVIISAGFKEAGKEGIKMSDQILKTARKYDMRVIGPNCLGFIKPSVKLNASFANKMCLPGNIAFISQSGALCTAILDWSVKQNVGFSHFVSIGSMTDVGFHDLIDYFGNDPNTSSILIYMESLSDARRFLSAARTFARTKPIIVLKAGKSSEGSKAAMSHTGSIAGNDNAFDAAFKRAGVVRVSTIGELFDSAQTLAMQKHPKGNRLAIVTNAGGPGVIATDYLMSHGGKLAELSKETISKLNETLPASWSKGNPVDVLGDAGPEKYRSAVEACIKDPGVDGVLIILTPQAVTDATEIARQISSIPYIKNKTVLTSWMGEKDVEEGREILKNSSIPVYRIPESAIRCFMNMYHYSKNLELLYETPATIPHAFTPDTEANKKLINSIVKEGRYSLTEMEGKELLKNYQIPVTKSGLAKSGEEASEIASKVGYPVAMKIACSKIAHKTDVGGVKLNVKNNEEAKEAFDSIMSSVKEHYKGGNIDGVLVEEMASRKYEILIGSNKDPIFGPIIVFGMGGVAVEVFKDTNIGLPPLNMALSMRLIEDTKIYELLKGYRGEKGVDLEALQFLLYKFAYLVMDFPEIKEIDINPFALDDKGGIVLDARVVLDKDIAGKEVKPYSHMVISPYPKEYVKTIEMNDGEKVTLRPIKPEDEPMEAEMFTNFSEETQRYRFFNFIKDITHELLIRYTQIDYDREMAIIAEVEEDGKKKMAGVVRLIADPYNETGEFAIVVADPWQHKGLGGELADYILEIARDRKISRVYADFLEDNRVMNHMFQERGFKITNDAGMYHAELEL